MGRHTVAALAALVVSTVLTACGGGGASAGPPDAGVGYLDAATGVSPREDGVATATLPATMVGANMLVAIATGDGPDNPAAQRAVLTDTGHHQWTLHVHHIAFGSIIDVYTAPATGTEPGTAVSSELTVKRGDEGHTVTVMAYSHGALGPTAERNGNFGVAQTTLDVPAGHDVITVFGDGRQNAPLTLVSLSSAQRAPFTDDQSATLRKLRRRGGEIWRAYSLKEAFRAIVTGDLDPDDVEALIDRWISRASRSRLTPPQGRQDDPPPP